ncbi:helix-turn-helix domain-containing protein [Helicobacter sp.]|uniref:helix-turn-helix domain-containing protein n=1 Tax=Helicobacter sp. TaxID=218 RepID=UPI0039C626CF
MKAARKHKVYTQVQLSQYSGVSLDSIKRYETKDSSNITIENLRKIAKALDFEVYYFLEEENVPKSQDIVP